MCVRIKAEKREQTMHEINTRSKTNKLLLIPHANKTIRQRSYAYLAPRVFNLVPRQIASRREKSFKFDWKQLLLEQPRSFA
ncbi:hypothetical protein HHI36_011430, partial [Cryptolaemus montrouzieri]